MIETEYKKALSRMVTGITLVATRPDPLGPAMAMTVNSFTSVSLSPPVILWCLDRNSRSWQNFAKPNTFSVNVLAEHQSDLALRHTNPDTQYLDDNDTSQYLTGAPILNSALANIDCRVRKHVEMGDHRVFFADVEGVVSSDGKPMCYYQSTLGTFQPFPIIT